MARDAKQFMEAVNNGDPKAQYRFGLMYLNGTNGLKQDYSQAAKWFLKSAEKGNASAMFELGKLYEEGLGVERSINEAMKWYEKAGDLGIEEAKSRLDELKPNEDTKAPEPVSIEPPTSQTTSASPDLNPKLLRALENITGVFIGALFLLVILILIKSAQQEELARSPGYWNESLRTGITIVTSLIDITVGALSIWLTSLFFRSLAAIIRLLADIRNLLQEKRNQ